MISNSDFCSDLRRRIEEAYARSGNTCGWRLLASPSSVLERAEVAFIGLNPGGSFQPDDHAELAMSYGSAYVLEVWGGSQQPGASPLQKQVRALFERLSVEPEQVLAGNLVPFRSPSWDCLAAPDFSLHFGELLWTDILDSARPTLVIGMGRKLHAPLSRILGASNPRVIPVGWGRISAMKATFPGGNLVVLPHLSRFGIVTKAESASALRTLFEDRWRV
jgi:hypothetical protein